MLGVLVPARNEEKAIKNVISSIIKANINLNDIYIIDNNSSDRTKEYSEEMGVNVINCKKVGYQAALKVGMNTLIKKKYKKFLIVDGDNEIGQSSIINIIKFHENFDLIIGFRASIKRFGEKIVNKYFETKYNIKDMMCGLKMGNLKLYNPNNSLLFGIDLLDVDHIDSLKIYNLEIDLNPRSETRLGNSFKVNYLLIINLIKFHFNQK